MKQIVAVVKPYLAEEVLEGLRRAPLEALWVQEVKGVGRQKSYLDQYQATPVGEEVSADHPGDFLPKVEINLMVEDSRADEVLEKVVQVARTGRIGDGKVWVLPASERDVVSF